MTVGVTKIVGISSPAGSPACTRTPTIRCQLGGRKSTPLLPARGVDARESAPQKQRRPHDRRGGPRPFGLDSGDPQGSTVDARPSMCVYQA